MITLEKLTIGYGSHAVLPDISLAVSRGSFTAILGANGSGKSTLLKTLLGLLPPLAGSIAYEVPAGTRPNFGYVPQQETLDRLYLLSAFDVALMGTFGRVGAGRMVPASEKTFVRECLKQTGADVFARHGFSQLSGGQKQRVLIARALATRPDLLILDEPTAGIDAAATQSVMKVIEKIHRGGSQTILWVAHDLRLIRQFAEDVIWVHEGRVMHGKVADILNPQNMAELLDLEI